ncbi:MAG: zinc-ribbon domain-containing protein, partial [Lachnospiraceae bacterium]|nr:zinc-ribbon domain-containing protein [Lachnospiraceae bacterium]
QENVSQEKRFCKHCGNEFKEDMKFCQNCGKPCESEEVIRYCQGCGAVIEKDVKFCPKCGTKVVTKIDINLSGAEKILDKASGRFSMKKVGAILAALILVAVIAVVGIKVIPKIFVSPETLMSEGNYKKAYNKSKKEEKDDILIENLISSLCKESEDGLKDPASFKLRDAWYENKDKKRIVLYISGKNSLGGTTNNFWLFTFNLDEKKYKLFTAINDLEKEEYSSYDDTEEGIEKVLNNVARDVIREIYIDDNKLDKDLVERINGLHAKNVLKDVELLDEVKDIYPSEQSDDEA